MADYDLFTIGAGSGGVRASRIAAQLGARVAIAENDRIGGTCVIRGCVPKKLFVYASQVSEDIVDAAGYGWDIADAGFSWRKLVENKDAEIQRLSEIYEKNLGKAGVDIHREHARIIEPNKILLTPSNRTITAERILIATGATPSLPDIPGIEHAITSNEAFHLEVLPRRIAIVGGGYIAVEFAGIFNGLGCETSLLYRGEEILRGFDQDLRKILHEEMAKKGMRIRTRTQVEAIEKDGDACLIRLGGGATLAADLVFYATGRRPNTDGLGLETIGIERAPSGAIQVDGDFHAGGNVYAIGDVIDRMQLTPVAIREGAVFAHNMFAPKDALRKMHYDFVPTAVFSQPALSTVGLAEEKARKRYGDVVVYESRFRPMRHTLSGRDEAMYVKLVAEPDGGDHPGRILGAHLIGRDTAEMIQLLAIALMQGATKDDFDSTIAVHPTVAEELVTLTLANMRK